MKHTGKKLLYKDCMKFTRIPCLIYLVQECGEGLVSVFIATLIGSFADAVFVLDMQYAIANMWRLIICLCFTVIFVPILTIIADIQCFKNTLRYERKLLSRFFEKDYADAMQYEYGEVSQRLEDDSIEFRYNIINIFTKTVTSVAMLVALLIMALPLSPAFTVIVFIISLVKLIVPIAVRKLDKKYDTLTREYNEHITSIEMELTTKPHIVKMMGIDAPFRKKLEYLFDQYYRTSLVKSIRCKRISGGISSLLDVLCTVIILYLGSLFVASNHMTPGSIAAMIGYFSVINTIIGNTGAMIRILPIMNTISGRLQMFYEHSEPIGGDAIDEIKHLIVNDLGYSYDEESVLSNLSFSINYGQKVAIIGDNGSGKTTLVKILSSLITKKCGSIKINNIDIEHLSIESRRAHIAYAEQNPYLFKGTVRENIRLGNLSATNAEIDKLAKYLGIFSLCDRDVIGEEDLSGGEKQKISIARALLKDTEVILLDEPSNHLDGETKEWLMQFIKNSTKTIIYISHDNELTSCADQVIHL